MSIVKLAGGAVFLSLAAGCAGAPFSYAEDRCTGSHNQCQTACTGIDNGPARSACIERCYTQEDRCRMTGDDGVGSSLAEESLIGRGRTQSEKEAEYRRWKSQRDRERAEAGETPPDVEIEVLEKSPEQ